MYSVSKAFFFKNPILENVIDIRSSHSVPQVCNESNTNVKLEKPMSYRSCSISSVSIYFDLQLSNVAND